MKLRSLALIAIFLLPAVSAYSGVKVTLSDELAPLYPDSRIEKAVLGYSVDAARGTIASVHLLFNGLKPGDELSFRITGAKVSEPAAKWYRLIDVPVAENTGLDSRTEKFSEKTNPYVIRRAPFRIYEALDPVVPPVGIKSGTEVYRLEIPVDAGLNIGVNDFTIEVSAPGFHKKLTFNVIVHHAQVPPLQGAHLEYVNWHSNGRIAADHGVEIWSEPFWSMLGSYARLMARGRQNTFWFIWSDFFRFNPDGSVAEFYGERFDRYIRTFLDEGLTTIQGAPFARRRNWETDAFLLAVPVENGKEIPMLSEEGLKIFRSMANPILARLKENRWNNSWVQGIFDEPTEEYVERYKATAAVLKSLDPGIRILEATMTVSLAGIVDCWCPQVQEYQANMDFFKERRAAGDEVWVYTCLIPGGPWINRLVDQERLRQVYVGWACSKYDLQGFLHWGLNHHRGKPFEELVRQHENEKSFLPAGDSHIIYPGSAGPLSSLRYEAHRIGMEDYELLLQLKKLNPVLADELTNRLFQAFNQYNTDISTYRGVKSELLKSLK
ncbi:MAG: hypothetical protein A2X22_02205 [Bacteroidetes bacterium GWF2_49_14]|nr:MAG: hypothetical protein A2X22_02205 [Bacteroidetes bacterium GWF2_49_14]